ncbi:MAG: type II secretion system F family protein [Lachnospiraceae bacterium]|nr:type II secretion system F family protein [Lachnospiraceae bacterium]
MIYLPYLIIIAAFAVLFILSRGMFRSSAVYLRIRFPQLADTVSEKTLSRMLIILFCTALLGAASVWKSKDSDTAAKGYLIRNEYGEEGEQAALTVELDGEKQDVDISVASRRMTGKEKKEAMDAAEDGLMDALLGDTDAEHVDRDLTFPSSVGGLPVELKWDTENPELVGWDGILGEDIPEEGAEATLTVRLICEEEQRDRSVKIRVFPRSMSESEQARRTIQAAVDAANDETEETVKLPETVGGRRAVWSTRQGNTGGMVLLMGGILAFWCAYSEKKKKDDEEAKRMEEMIMDYPNIVSKLVLLITAGMSLRKAFARIRDDYRDLVHRGRERRAGYEEIVRMSLEMERGVSELVAYENLGKRCRVPAYRTFSTLLIQNLTKGGDEMAAILRREADEAFEERKKRARILGEEAGTKLLLPMLLMLVIVMAILMVPAFFAFF